MVKGLYRRDQLFEEENIPSTLSSAEIQAFYHQFHSAPIGSSKHLHVMIPDHILDFLVAYLDDGKYFPDNYFTHDEKRGFEFNE